MKNFLTTVKSKALTLKDKVLNKSMPALLAIAGVLATIEPTFATATDPDALVKSIITIVLKMARYIGMVLVVTGVFQLVMAYKDDNADSKTRGIQLAICGVILIGLEAVLTAAGIL
ncbi:MAG: DUF2460 domain-containing protein [Lachnospiraceae bacterium]|nr:DUF2460 domain-containing protein [Lachnospiraceae bacterium]